MENDRTLKKADGYDRLSAKVLLSDGRSGRDFSEETYIFPKYFILQLEVKNL